MNYEKAITNLQYHFDGLSGSAEKDFLLELQCNARNGSAVKALIVDLLTNDFLNYPDSSYTYNALETNEYNKHTVIALAKLVYKVLSPTIDQIRENLEANPELYVHTGLTLDQLMEEALAMYQKDTWLPVDYDTHTRARYNGAVGWLLTKYMFD